MAMELPGGKWQLESYNFRNKMAYPVDLSSVTLNVNAEGKLGGRSGCNIYGGGYTIEDGVLKIGDVISTMMACDDMTMQFERAYFDTLAAVSNFEEVEGRLTLSNPATLQFLRFTRVKDKDRKDE